MSLTRARYDALIDVPRALWDPTEGRHPRSGERTIGSIVGLEVHWIGDGSVGDHGDTGTELLDFERYHERSKGWADLFYNVGADTEGLSYEGRDVTIASQANLARWLTLLIVLGDDDTPTEAELDRIRFTIWRWHRAIDPTGSPSSIRRHRDRASTACPGSQVSTLVDEIRAGWIPAIPEGITTMTAPITFYDDSDAKKTLAVDTAPDGRPRVFTYGTYRPGQGIAARGLSWVALHYIARGDWIHGNP